jgi:hypothetical protein
VAVDDRDALEAVVRDALGDVGAEVDEVLRLDVDRAGEVDVVQVEAVRDRRQDQDLVRRAPRQFLSDLLRQEHVGVERQVRPVLLQRPDRHHEQPPCPRRDVRPVRGG